MKTWPLILLLPAMLHAQEDPWADDEWDDAGWDDQELESRWSGFAEAGLGTRVDSDPLVNERNTLEELRLRVESEWVSGKATITLAADATYDGVEDDWDADFRDLSISFPMGDSTDVRIGRQVQTWGTGDLVFLNDLFPKDFVSFFAGRDDEYLKAPGNAIRVTRFWPMVNVELAWSPDFEPDIYLDGERFSFFSPLTGNNIAPRPPLVAIEPGSGLSNGELALRLFRTIEGREYAVYAYRGYFKQPNALTPALQATFAPLATVGASLRRPMGSGLFNTEFAWYRSRDDSEGSNPLLPNDQFRFLLGYEWEARQNFTVGLQYYLEATLDYDALIANSPAPQFEPDEYRHVLTNRLSYRAGRDKHRFSLFTFFSPSDGDFYLRPSYAYRYSDTWTFVAGGNLFGGDDRHTFFSQLSDASNLYLRIRFNY